MDTPDEAIVFFSKRAIEHKKLEEISINEVHKAFDRKDLKVFTNTDELEAYLISNDWQNKNLLMMSSGNFDGMDFDDFSSELFS
jgi:UDP-N-acetylmuramate: L-alanyl-gamma-D-glutamyl-meso-diaminopimelate ligase